MTKEIIPLSNVQLINVGKIQFVVIYFLYFASTTICMIKCGKKMISFEQPLAPKITPGSVVRKLGKVVHWVNHYSVRVSDFSVG